MTRKMECGCEEVKEIFKGIEEVAGCRFDCSKKKEEKRNLILFDGFEPSTHLQILSQTHYKLKLLT